MQSDLLLQVQRQVQGAVALKQQTQRDLVAVQKQRADLAQQRELLQQAFQVAESAAHLGRRQVKDTVEKVVTAALRSVFDTDDISFRVEFVSRRNQVEADFFVDSAQRGESTDSITDEYGGGYVDVIAFALRVALLELLHIPGPLILDESFRMVSRDQGFASRAGQFLRKLSETLNRQIILVTHNEDVAAAAHSRLRVTQVAGASRVTKEDGNA